MVSPAFAVAAATSSFTSTSATSPLCPLHTHSSRVAVRRTPMATFMAPQPGDPGYKPPPPVKKGTGMTKSEPKPSEKKKLEEEAKAAEAAKSPEAGTDAKSDDSSSKGGMKLPVTAATRGLNLLRDDLLKNAPVKLGFGRQDVGAVMKPMAGEPGYKPAAFQTVKVSELGISPFPDDANAVGNVGGIEAVKKAAFDVKVNQKTAKEIQKEVLKIETKIEPEVFDIPDYLKPIPEDTPKKGYSWKNYDGQ